MFNSHWGGVVENNHFGTHEFLDLCEMLGIEPYVSLNVGSGSVQEAMEWVEYITSPASSPMANLRRANGRDKPWKVKFFGIGNESWGCGGNMTPEFYADNYRRYNTFVKNYVPGPENRLYRIACGSSGRDLNWTEVLMKNAGKQMKSVWRMPAPRNDEKRFGKHPTQKPVGLVERCILASTNEGDLVLDPFLGGGTTAVAAVETSSRPRA